MPTFNIDGKSYTIPDGFSAEENQAMLKQMMGTDSASTGQAATGQTQSGGVGTITDPTRLSYDPQWMKNVAALYAYNTGGKKFVGTDQQLSDWGVTQMRFMNNNLASLAVDTVRIQQAPQAIKDSFVDMMEQYDKIDYTWGGAAEAAGAQVLDPSNWSGLLTLGVGTAVAGGAKIAGKSALKALLKEGLKTGVKTGIENAVQNAAMDAAQQSIKIDAGRQKDFSTGELATQAGAGAVLGGALGVASPFVGKAVQRH